MANKEQVLSAEQLDFLSEMMNIGAGNAATALTQMLQCPVEAVIPKVHFVAPIGVPPMLGDPSLSVVCVRMGMVGDATGDLLFIVPEEHKKNLIHLAEQAAPGTAQSRSAVQKNQKADGLELSVMAEIGNIVAGVYLTALHDFCTLHIHHTVPTVAIDMFQALLDETLADLSRQVQLIIMIENEFIVEQERIRSVLMMVPSLESLNVLLNSIDQARMAMLTDER